MKFHVTGIFLFSLLVIISCSQNQPKNTTELTSSYLNDSVMADLEISISNKSKFDCDLLNENPPGDTPKIFAQGKVSIGRENAP